MKIFKYGEEKLTIAIAISIANGETKGIISDVAAKKISKSQNNVQTIVEKGATVYGINTGFGSLCTTVISKGDTKKLQTNILRSHSVGIGDNIPDTIAKLMMILKVHALSQGYSGIQQSTLERIIWHIDNDIIPKVPSKGSLGASGDLAPLAHLFLPLIGLGVVSYNGKITDTQAVFQKESLSPIELAAKEGLALINGTQFIAAHAIYVVANLLNTLDVADIVGAMSLEAMLGSINPFKSALHDIRPFKGSIHVAHRLTHILSGSQMVESHENCDRVQDPYSLRCMPQVHGASRNAWLHLKELVDIEINAVTDNPIILSAEESISGGNFHGQPLALPLDYATLAAHELGNISERRTYLLLEGKEGLPQLLMKETGTNSGFMIPQYTAAALVSENKSLCFPASADSIPSSLGQEDHVSMGSISGRKALQVIDNLEGVLAIELLCAAQAFDFRRPLKSSILLEACHEYIRQNIDHAEEDRVFAHDINIAKSIVQSGELVNILKKQANDKNINLKSKFDELFRLH